MKHKICRSCKISFAPERFAQTCCSIPCAIAHSRKLGVNKSAEKAKLARKERIDGLAKLKTRREYVADCQKAFNAMIRARDISQLCICCDKPLTIEAVGGGYDCGHYRSVGSAPHLRFDERNAHGQTKQCNRWGSGRAVDYRLGLIKRIGLEAVEALECDQTTRKYTVVELKELITEFRLKTKIIIGGRQ